MVDPKIRNGIEKCNLPGAHESGKIIKSTSDNQETQVGNCNEVCLLAGEERSERIQVAVSELLHTVSALWREALVSSADIEQHIELPSEDLVSQQGHGVVKRGFFDQFDKLGVETGLLVVGLSLSGRNKDSVLVNVAMVTVVSSMGDLPRVEGHHQEGMHRPSNKVIQTRILGEGSMTTFVTNDPHSGANTALEKTIKNPGASPEKWRWQVIDLKS